mgnify:CR=1
MAVLFKNKRVGFVLFYVITPLVLGFLGPRVLESLGLGVFIVPAFGLCILVLYLRIARQEAADSAKRRVAFASRGRD